MHKETKGQIDPVCGMKITDESVPWQSEYLGTEYYFCSEGCKQKFDQRPNDYVAKSGAVSGQGQS